MSKKGKTYSREFKIEAVKLSYNSERTVEELATELGVSKSSLFRWRKEFGHDPDQVFPGRGQMKERDGEMARLQKELREAKMENEILKKAMAIFAQAKR
jgi:transposase